MTEIVVATTEIYPNIRRDHRYEVICENGTHYPQSVLKKSCLSKLKCEKCIMDNFYQAANMPLNSGINDLRELTKCEFCSPLILKGELCIEGEDMYKVICAHYHEKGCEELHVDTTAIIKYKEEKCNAVD